MRSATALKTLTVAAVLALSATFVGSAGAGGLSSRTSIPPFTGNAPVHPHASVDTCSLIDFEGLGDFNPVGIFAGPVTVTFGTSWLSLVDADNGGSGNFANEPSPNTIAFFLDTNDISISLNPGVRFVRFWYVASSVSLPIVVTAYDAANNVVSVANGNTVGTSFDGAPCVGDPNGQFCLWDQVTLTSPFNIIRSITIQGTIANQFGIDNLQFCVEANPTPALRSSWGKIKILYR